MVSKRSGSKRMVHRRHQRGGFNWASLLKFGVPIMGGLAGAAGLGGGIATMVKNAKEIEAIKRAQEGGRRRIRRVLRGRRRVAHRRRF